MNLEYLPTLNAFLNATSAILVLTARQYIRAGNIPLHRKTMIAAVSVSTLFLISYLTYHATHGSTRYSGQGGMRVLYFSILITHTLLAAMLVPMVFVTLRRGLLRADALHKQIARWTYPIWVYVSVTGVVIHVMLYRL